MAKVAILIDFANINFAFEQIKKERKLPFTTKLDFNKLISALTLGNTIISKSIYLPTCPDQKSQIKFFHFFRKNEFNVVTKEIKEITKGDGTILRKANFDVEITMDACAHIWRRECDEIILFSGDSDFAYLIEQAKELNFKISVLASRKTISTELHNLADRVILIDELDPNTLTFSQIHKKVA